jgi:hypothetical protein
MIERIPVIIKPEYTVSFERYQGLTFIHCDVRKWNKTSRGNLLSDFGLLRAIHTEPIFAFHDIGDGKHKKFLETYGFKYLRTFQGNDLRLREIWVVNN